jgi:hypothetical protein
MNDEELRLEEFEANCLRCFKAEDHGEQIKISYPSKDGECRIALYDKSWAWLYMSADGSLIEGQGFLALRDLLDHYHGTSDSIPKRLHEDACHLFEI